MTESTKRRALNAFAAMGTLSDAYILSAEEALYEAEAGIYRPAKPMGPVRRFLNSGWGAAVISGIVALTVLLLIIRAGQNPPTNYPPPVPPAGSSIEMSDEGVNFTIATEQASYPEGMNRFTVIMTGKTKGEVISMHNAWYLERLTDEGAEAVAISYTEEAIESAEPGRDEYAVIDKYIYGTNTGGGFMPGTYRLHATKHDGEKYVSVAYCTFTVEEAPTFRKSNYPGPFEILSLSVDSDANSVTVEVEAIDPMTSLVDEPRYWYIQRADGSVPNASLAWYVSATSEERFALKYHNGEALENGGYARFTETITLQFPEEWIAGEYVLYALTEPLKKENEYFAWYSFTITAPIAEIEKTPSEFTIAARSPSYPKWTSSFSVILTSPTAMQDLTSIVGWYLERLTAEGAKGIGNLSVNTGYEIAMDANSIQVPLHVPITDLDSGLYRVHALGQEGNKQVSLASCTFTVEENERVLNRFEFHPMDGTAPYTVTVPDIPYGSDSLTIIVTATEPGVPLNDPPLHWFIGKLNSGHWPFDDDLDPWDASVTEIKEVLPSEETDGYAQLRVTLNFRYPPEWTPGLYYLYALTEPFREYNYLVASCRFSIIESPTHSE